MASSSRNAHRPAPECPSWDAVSFDTLTSFLKVPVARPDTVTARQHNEDEGEESPQAVHDAGDYSRCRPPLVSARCAMAVPKDAQTRPCTKSADIRRRHGRLNFDEPQESTTAVEALSPSVEDVSSSSTTTTPLLAASSSPVHEPSTAMLVASEDEEDDSESGSTDNYPVHRLPVMESPSHLKMASMDAPLFGHFPLVDSIELLVCKHCSRRLRTDGFLEHARRCRRDPSFTATPPKPRAVAKPIGRRMKATCKGKVGRPLGRPSKLPDAHPTADAALVRPRPVIVSSKLPSILTVTAARMPCTFL